MQGRMKQHQLTPEEIYKLLARAQVGRIATRNPNEYPYLVPVHFIVLEGKIYIHGLAKGQKISNILKDEKVCFEVDEMGAILPDEGAVCDTNTEFQSVVILGTARIVAEAETKDEVLRLIVGKYTPSVEHVEFSANLFKATGVIEITPVEVTGKYYR